VFVHGDLQVDHVFVTGDEVTGCHRLVRGIQGDALFDLATLTLGHPEHLGDVVAGYGTDVDRDLISAWWSLRCLSNVRWLINAGYGTPDEFPRWPCCDPGCEAAHVRRRRHARFGGSKTTGRSDGAFRVQRRRYVCLMRPLRYSINVTLDGCCDHREGIADEELHRHAAENLAQADALLFGRVTYK
jgi:hypothetical protein